MPITQPWEKKEEDQNYMDKHTISYYSKSDGKKLKRPYDPSTDMQYEFTAKSTGNYVKDTGMFPRTAGVQLKADGKFHQ